MVSFRDFILGQPLEKKDEQQPEELEEKKPEEKKPKSSIFDGGKTLRKKNLINLAGHKDSYGNIYNTGEYSSNRSQITKIIEEALAYKNSDETFNRDDIRRIAVALKNKSDRASQLAGKSLEEVLNQ